MCPRFFIISKKSAQKELNSDNYRDFSAKYVVFKENILVYFSAF
ncbi:hypothetical protein AQPE_2731 [Aquipluma nitroreducens]|uniref:Uncharacterized protein n=1 Tax=Aquipluma nitroreducens TaxID=2010828 RepID=A0A5K7SAF8_9BACT|nr:hypothetical protein AQPE_2731 [Aquipluma nitroreducens]